MIRQRWTVLGLLGALFTPYVAVAALGGPEVSTAADAEKLGGSIKASDRSAYRVQEITLPSGTVVREFAQPGGMVFAVSWRGPVIPNLEQTLGAYYDTFVTAAKASRSGHTHLEVRQNDFVMHSSGHMRAFSGLAYLPQAIPAGVTVQDLH